MNQGRQSKEQWAKDFYEKASKAQLSVFLSYRGLKAQDADLFRKKIRDAKGEVRVIKNNVARKAFASASGATSANSMKEVLDGIVGPTFGVFAYQDPAALAKVIHEFLKDNEALSIKEGVLGAQKLAAADVEALAKLPPKPVLMAQLLGVLNGPARGFVSVLAAVPRGLVTVLKAIEDKKRDAGGQ